MMRYITPPNGAGIWEVREANGRHGGFLVTMARYRVAEPIAHVRLWSDDAIPDAEKIAREIALDPATAGTHLPVLHPCEIRDLRGCRGIFASFWMRQKYFIDGAHVAIVTERGVAVTYAPDAAKPPSPVKEFPRPLYVNAKARILCPHCPKTFAMAGVLENHLWFAHRDGMTRNLIYALICEHGASKVRYVLPRKGDAPVVRNAEGVFVCPHCPKPYTYAGALSHHLRHTHGDQITSRQLFDWNWERRRKAGTL